MLKFDRILLVSAHPDDTEMGAGGTIARLKRENSNCKIWHIFFCPCLEDLKNIGCIEEHSEAMIILGIEKDININMPRSGYLESHMQEVRDILWKLKNEFHPDLVLCPSLCDFHQDHNAVTKCCETIFRFESTILGYEIPRSTKPDFVPNLYIMLSRDDICTKLKAIEQYKHQFETRPETFNLDKLKAHLIMRGMQANTLWAEAFEVLWGRI